MGVVKKKPKGHIEMHSAHNGVKYFLFDFDFKNIRGEQLRNFEVSGQLALKLKNTLIGVSNTHFKKKTVLKRSKQAADLVKTIRDPLKQDS